MPPALLIWLSHLNLSPAQSSHVRPPQPPTLLVLQHLLAWKGPMPPYTPRARLLHPPKLSGHGLAELRHSLNTRLVLTPPKRPLRDLLHRPPLKRLHLHWTLLGMTS